MYYRDQTRFYCTIMRGGTSKGVFFRENDLPQDPVLRDKVILSIFGSPDKRQIDGLGGADMLTSKLALISAPTKEGADVDYVFGQVDIEKPIIHYDGLCGNISAAVGPYAIEEGFVKAVEPITKVRVHSRNTRQIFIAEVPVKDGKPLATGDYEIAAVPGKGAKIQIDMAATAGSRTGKALPTGNAIDILDIPGFGKLESSLLDLVNPCIFVRAADIGMKGDEKPADVDDDKEFMVLIDKIRVAAVERMGFSKDWAPKNPTPFVVFVSSPRDYTDHLTGKPIKAPETDFLARMIMLGKMHQTYAGSVSCVTGLAAVVPGSLVNQTANPKAGQIVVRIGHPAGVIEVEAEVEISGGEIKAKRVTYGRSSRRIMDGYAYVPHTVFE